MDINEGIGQEILTGVVIGLEEAGFEATGVNILAFLKDARTAMQLDSDGSDTTKEYIQTMTIMIDLLEFEIKLNT